MRYRKHEVTVNCRKYLRFSNTLVHILYIHRTKECTTETRVKKTSVKLRRGASKERLKVDRPLGPKCF